jgi:magnesium transporter
MLRALYARGGGACVPVEGADEVARIVREGKGCLWVDFEQPTEDDRRVLSSAFPFHPLAVESCLAQTSHPRLHDYGDYVYLVVHAVRGVQPLATEEVDVFIGPNYVVTYHGGPVASLEEVRKRAQAVDGMMKRGADRVLAEILDELADGYVDMMAKLDQAVDGLEDRLFKHASRPALREIFGLKKDVLHLRRIVSPQREVLNRLARGEFKVISKEEAIFFRDVCDHIYRVSEMLESFRDVLTSAMEVYLTAVSNRISEVMKVLTIVSIILMSASLMAGIYGMNFREIPLAGSPAGFYVLVGLMAALSGALLLLFRKRRWI